MKIFERMYEKFVLIEKVKTRDSEGGWIVEEKETDEFLAVVILNTSKAQILGQSERVKDTYSVTTPKDTQLNQFDEFKRISDGVKFRIVSETVDRKTPEFATFEFKQFTAEVVNE